MLGQFNFVGIIPEPYISIDCLLKIYTRLLHYSSAPRDYQHVSNSSVEIENMCGPEQYWCT
ncbi:hypothetical protein JMJ77_0001710 [Colletotrichum scovillei]|uniref:Uncharacterized protein n=1 Tax=Colletotrichum scovillei TaxID=1209932 RepID=A0A9P7R895_9PEZI|nr:hypothetical protein JMJ77_0001710 [Colletotrichum scovillei]KAG7070118.1 hypothetical protein JMJ76_0001375 [Colletotrichum scovillei]KAG7078367.1 hypothetical protein JMJ78_0002039 [Colletotrichum scovillei]